MKKEITIATDFNRCPGGRYISDGPWSGQKFLEEILEPAMNNHNEIVIILDGTAGYAASFLEESFGGIAQKLGLDEAKKRIHFISKENPELIGHIYRYMEKAVKSGKPSNVRG